MPAKKKTPAKKRATKKAVKKTATRKAAKKAATKRAMKKTAVRKAVKKTARKLVRKKAAAPKKTAKPEETKRSFGILSTAKHLLDQVPPEFRQAVIEKVKTHGPAAALVTVQALARKTKNPKAKLALTGFIMLLSTMVSNDKHNK